MNRILKKWNDLSLIFRIACGLVLGVILGLIFPNASAIGILGDIFVGALKSIAPILVFFLVISAVANASNTVSKRFRTVVLLYILSTLLASILAVIASKIFPISLRLVAAVSNEAPEGIAQVFKNLLNNIVQNPIASIANANYIGILAWAIVLGLALKKINHQPTNEILISISDAVSATVRWIINLAPLGILGLVFVAISTNGLSVFVDYGKLLLVLVGCMLFLALVINPFITFIMLRKNPYPLVWRCLKESGITAFFTRSSAANIPVNMELCRKLGLDKDIYSISIPLGATINMILASVLAEGTTFIENAAKEPHIVDLANFLNTIGADISGAGTSEIVINGVKQEDLHSAEYTTIPDRIEAGTFMAAVVATKGKALIKNIYPAHLTFFNDSMFYLSRQ